MTPLSNSSQSTHPIGRVLGKNYSSFLDFTLNTSGGVEFLSPEGPHRDGQRDSWHFIAVTVIKAIQVPIYILDGGLPFLCVD